MWRQWRFSVFSVEAKKLWRSSTTLLECHPDSGSPLHALTLYLHSPLTGKSGSAGTWAGTWDSPGVVYHFCESVSLPHTKCCDHCDLSQPSHAQDTCPYPLRTLSFTPWPLTYPVGSSLHCGDTASTECRETGSWGSLTRVRRDRTTHWDLNIGRALLVAIHHHRRYGVAQGLRGPDNSFSCYCCSETRCDVIQ